MQIDAVWLHLFKSYYTGYQTKREKYTKRCKIKSIWWQIERISKLTLQNQDIIIKNENVAAENFFNLLERS